jgi:hypothetical protein
MGITVVRDDCDARVWTDATREALSMVSLDVGNFSAARQLVIATHF